MLFVIRCLLFVCLFACGCCLLSEVGGRLLLVPVALCCSLFAVCCLLFVGFYVWCGLSLLSLFVVLLFVVWCRCCCSSFNVNCVVVVCRCCSLLCGGVLLVAGVVGHC